MLRCRLRRGGGGGGSMLAVRRLGLQRQLCGWSQYGVAPGQAAMELNVGSPW